MEERENQKAIELMFSIEDKMREAQDQAVLLPPIAVIMKKMLDEQNGSMHDINHLMKVWTYSRTIGQLEHLDAKTQYILEAAAVMHDIACPSLRAATGRADGKDQEKEGPVIGKRFLAELNMPQEQTERILYLIGHHHTLTGINGMDYQILIEADYLVNADESSFSPENIRNYRDKIFKTQAGLFLLNSIYGERMAQE